MTRRVCKFCHCEYQGSYTIENTGDGQTVTVIHPPWVIEVAEKPYNPFQFEHLVICMCPCHVKDGSKEKVYLEAVKEIWGLKEGRQ